MHPLIIYISYIQTTLLEVITLVLKVENETEKKQTRLSLNKCFYLRTYRMVQFISQLI